MILVDNTGRRLEEGAHGKLLMTRNLRSDRSDLKAISLKFDGDTPDNTG